MARSTIGKLVAEARLRLNNDRIIGADILSWAIVNSEDKAVEFLDPDDDEMRVRLPDNDAWILIERRHDRRGEVRIRV